MRPSESLSIAALLLFAAVALAPQSRAQDSDPQLEAAQRRIRQLEAENDALREQLNARNAAQPAPEPQPAPDPLTDPHETDPPTLEPLVDFDTFNVVYLYGFNWKLGNESRDIVTLEYAADTRWGDIFAYVDVSNIITEDVEAPVSIFGELVPRFSMSHLTGEDLSFGPVKDVMASYNLEFGSNPAGDPLCHLYGVGLNLDIPGFRFATLDAFLRDDTDLAGVTWQVTAVGMIPFQISGLDLSYGGFVDIAGPEATSEFNIVSGTRLLLDTGKLLYNRPGEFFIGTEIAIWHNEFGINGQDEFVPQLAVQFSF